MIQNKEELYAWEGSSRDTIDVKRIYVDLTSEKEKHGDLTAGILLSQIVFWHLPNAKHQSKLRVQHNGKYWLAKTRGSWWDECRITPKQYDRAIQILIKEGLVETELFKFASNPTVHIRLNEDVLIAKLNKRLEIGYSPKVNNDIPQR